MDYVEYIYIYILYLYDKQSDYLVLHLCVCGCAHCMMYISSQACLHDNEISVFVFVER